MLDPSAVTRVEIANVLVSDQTGRVDHLAGYGASEVRAIPRVYSLDANYPNPFNPETTVPYAVPNAGDVKLAIYNALGQRIAVLAQGRRGAGYYRAVWDGRDEIGREVASGIYFVRMSAEGFTAVRKMMVLK